MQLPGESFNQYAARLEAENKMMKDHILSVFVATADEYRTATLQFIADSKTTKNQREQFPPIDAVNGR